MADQKPPAGQAAGNTGAEPGGGTFKNLGSMGEGEIRAQTNMVAQTSAEQGHDDLKNMAEHLKGDSGEASLDELNLQDSGEGGLDGMNLQDAIDRTSESQQVFSNVIKKMTSTEGSIISNLGGGSKPKGKAGLGILAGLLLLGIAVFVGVRFFAPSAMQPETTVPEAGTPSVNIPAPGASDQSSQYPPNPCDLEFENPLDPEGIPLQGALEVAWTRVPKAASYEFQVIPPEGAGSPWIIATDQTSKKIYMENFPAAGQHTFALTALDANGAPLCSIEMAFDKPATGSEDRQARDSEAAAGGCNTLMGCPP